MIIMRSLQYHLRNNCINEKILVMRINRLRKVNKLSLGGIR